MDFSGFKKKYQKKDVLEYPNKVTNNPVVSVCVQTYNQIEFLPSCLDGILMQKTNFEIEILLGEDASSDGTRELCIQYAQKHPDKIRLFLHERENNIKVGENYTGIFNSLYNFFSARGKYVAYCDGDDFWTDPNKLQKQVDFMDLHPKYVISYHKAIFVNREGKRIDDEGYPGLSERDFSSTELKKVVVQPIISTWCFRRVIKELPSDFTQTIIPDNFWISLLGFHGEGKYLPEIQPSHYRIHQEGIWSLIHQEKKLLSKMISYDNMSKFYSEKNEEQLVKYFKKRSRNYSKMLVLMYLKKFSLINAFQNGLFFLKSKLSTY